MKMYDMIRSFPHQIINQYETLSKFNINSKSYVNINHVVIVGMGGSAISGDIASNILKDYLKVPITVVRDYTLPNWVNKNTLVILSSYSGNTEETLSVTRKALNVTEMIISITTGGELKKISERSNITCVFMPTGYQPRAALGYSFTSLLMVLNKINLINKDVIKLLLGTVNELEVFFNEKCCKNQFAHKIAQDISQSVIGVYGTEASTDAIASRFRAQIAENSKLIAFHHSLPELNHNEIEGWNVTQFGDIKKNIIWLSDLDDHKRVQKRIKITSELLSGIDINNIFICCEGENYILRQLKLILLTDMISYYLAVISNIDPIPVNRIMSLKKKMS